MGYDLFAMARKKKGMSQEELGRMVGVSRDTIRRWEKGITTPTLQQILKVANALGKSASSLVEEAETKKQAEVDSTKKYIDVPGSQRGPVLEVIELPILSSEITACCGDGTPFLELTTRAERTVLFPKDRIGRIDDLRPPFAINSEGDSMEGFGIPEGALVAVNPAEEVRPGNIALVCIGSAVAFKKIYMRPSGYELASSDGRAPIMISGEEAECGWFKILGRGQGAIVDLDQEP